MKLTSLFIGLFAALVSVTGNTQMNRYFPGTGPVTTEMLFSCLKSQQLAVAAADLEKHLAPAIRLVGVNNSLVVKPTQSKFGGQPALPASLDWPSWQGTNLMFLAQINFRELQSATPRAELPATGLLLFFYDAHQSTWGFDPKDKGSWQVIYMPDEPVVTKRQSWPQTLPAEARMKPVPMKFQAVQTLPSEPHKVTGYDDWSQEQQDRFDEVLYEFLERNKPMHQLLGHAVPIQSPDMALECQLVSHGLYCGDGTGYNDPRAETLKAGAKDWVLLAMIDTDDARELMWGDGGCLYFWIRQHDLRARKFENVWMILQCY